MCFYCDMSRRNRYKNKRVLVLSSTNDVSYEVMRAKHSRTYSDKLQVLDFVYRHFFSCLSSCGNDYLAHFLSFFFLDSDSSYFLNFFELFFSTFLNNYIYFGVGKNL